MGLFLFKWFEKRNDIVIVVKNFFYNYYKIQTNLIVYIQSH